MKCPRACAAAAVCNGKIFVCGGYVLNHQRGNIREDYLLPESEEETRNPFMLGWVALFLASI